MNVGRDDRLGWLQYHDIVFDAAHAYVDWITPVGCVDKIIAAYGFHNDVAARNCLFALQQGAGLAMRDITTPVLLASGAYSHLYTEWTGRLPLILRAGHTLRFGVSALGGGKTASMIVTFERQKGHETYID
jgi:hypothetical protein